MFAIHEKKSTNIHIINIIYSVLIGIFFYLTPLINDDVMNLHTKKLYSFSGILHQVGHMYFTWSNRIFINPVMYIMTTLFPKVIFAFVTGVVIYCILLYLNQQFNEQNDYRLNITFLIILSLFPFLELATAGWIATTVTYLWPLGAVALALILPDRPITLVISFILFLWGLNNEQLCAIMILVLMYYFIVHLIHRSKPQNPKIWLLSGASIINLIIILLCPGNVNRKAVETVQWFPGFNQLNIINKLDLGIITTIQHYLFGFNLIFIVFAIVVFVIAIRRYPIIGALPLIIVVITNCLTLLMKEPPKVALTPLNGVIATMSKTGMIQYIIALIWLFATGFLLYKIDSKLLFLLLIGFIGHILIGISPTVYASATRTFVFSDAIIIYITIKLIQMSWHHINWSHYWAIFILGVAFNLWATVDAGWQINYLNWQSLSLRFWTQIPSK
jgi:hypothetical protein